MAKNRVPPALSAAGPHRYRSNRPSITDDTFVNNAFFDGDDPVQVKYEMLRRVAVDGYSVTRVTESFGFSRPAFYQFKATFDRLGLIGLLPRKPGPQRARKWTTEIREFVNEALAAEHVAPPMLARLIRERFGVKINPRTIQRHLRAAKG